jgi:hypothetical protein
VRSINEFGTADRKETMRVIEIVSEHLKANGFDGLVNGDAPCGCDLERLQPCGMDFSSCEPGYKHMDPRRPGDPHAWAIWKTKSPPKPESWEEVDY